MPAHTSPKRRRLALMGAAALVLAGCSSSPNITMPEVRGKSCEHYAAMIADLTGLLDRKEVEMQAETAGFMAASVGLSVLVPFAGLALIPAEQEAKRDTYQAQSDLWSFRVAYKARGCLPLLDGESQ